MMKTAIPLTLLAVLLKKVAAHGFVQYAIIDGQYWQGFAEAEKPGGSALLVTDYNLPNYDVWDPRIACGTNPQAAGAVAEVHPGSSVEWGWRTHAWVDGGKTWTHHEGTKRTFIGRCIGSCSSTDPTQVEWAEIKDARWGYDSGSRQWAAEHLLQGNTWRDTVPAVPNGDYLMRNELTALHYSMQTVNPMDYGVGHGWGTEFYASCLAVRVSGSDGSWNPGTVMKFPGAYNQNEQWHYNPNFFGMDWSSFGWADTPGQYEKNGGVGGGAVSNGSSGGGGGGSSNTIGSPSNESPNNTNANGSAPVRVPNPMCQRRRKRSESKQMHHARYGSRTHL